jgi:tRNA dimethylallyltransferase
MLASPFSDALVLTGPTGSGKTQLALSLARRLDAEIISMDSMALYRRLDIGTAKPTLVERKAIRHHLVDVLDPWESASVAWWLQAAAACCREIAARGKQILIVGGTPLYLKAILFGLFDGPPADEALRESLRQQADTMGAEALHAQLAQVDPITAQRLPVNDLRRVIRALEVFELTGQPISAWQRQWSEPAQSLSSSPADAASIPRILWLDLARSVLYDRINRRVEEMFAGGLIEEVRSLVKLDKPLSTTARQALGYKEVIDHLAGRYSREETLTRVQTRSRNFAKRQITWFRHLPGCQSATPQLTETLWQPKIKITDFRLQI